MTVEGWNENSERTARKQHYCDWCNTTIEPGEKYLRWFGMTEYGVLSFKSHHECNDAIKREREEFFGDSEAVTWGEHHARGKTYEETHGMAFA